MLPARGAPVIAAVAACALCLAAPAHSVAKVTLTVSPVPTAKNPSPGTPVVTWATGDGSPGLVTVTTAGGTNAVFASGASGSSAAPWITATEGYEFRLYATGSGRRLLARLKLGRGAGGRTDLVAAPKRPRDTPEAVDRLLQVLPFGGLLAFGVLGILWLREERRDA